MAQLLKSGDVPAWLLDAAASLADSALVPALRAYDQDDELVRRALSGCDPEQRAARERAIAAFMDEAQRILDIESPGSAVSAWCARLDVDVLVSVHGPAVGRPRDERGESAARVGRPASYSCR